MHKPSKFDLQTNLWILFMKRFLAFQAESVAIQYFGNSYSCVPILSQLLKELITYFEYRINNNYVRITTIM